MQWYVLSLFLYFPEDKSEYIPSAITLVVFLIAAILTMRFIINVSKREARKTEELEKRINEQNQRNKDR
ncbi:hypothetical protein CVD25_11130 [Bacillus canaveralius]|uniref:Uncharacterized protein n=1 Tax=Bacillus canaveralius TaxID=1403243 RepID=A0A2N5GMI0_9BACI|nr:MULTISPECIES: hypothetical protein [Bacillus]PLR83041.1 hypothetical protein CU635_10065 [Bacillus canaveralius]PLR85191.1 hypothetical protein CVD23_09570 [Bacillus sp. V33-4]PLR97219.1 hypothetical protein CVD25_11130 [Bacillus canaveralius]RSK49800.1 hypothetical protein EJA13_15165 [Bacillus canaveralius]